ncbi:degT/DnrJ/EryC1/StrS aminotransferase [Vagococcus sp. WN89Y]|uniref:degT/DnrJ/EryC1/StrS aminotransferase n=1 Tax=Vagococcus sp. WN89Y TaxID=3457258 RepID=UPI003FCC3F2A
MSSHQTHDVSTQHFQVSFVLARVLTSGVIMSIEKNESELKGLENCLKKSANKQHAVTYNSISGAVIGALWGQDIVYGSKTNQHHLDNQQEKLLKWLGIGHSAALPQPYNVHQINWQNLHQAGELPANDSLVNILDFSALGFGPCAVLLTDDENIYKKAERLKIFGAFDLRTMWTQHETEKEIQPGLQFNFRLSPLVGACIKMALLKAGVNK